MNIFRFIYPLALLLVLVFGNIYGQDGPQSGLFTMKRDPGDRIALPSNLGDTISGKFYLNQMNKALWNALSLRFDCRQSTESIRNNAGREREMIYSVWMKKGNLARAEVRHPDHPGDGSTLIYDGRNMWAFYVGSNFQVVLDKNIILGGVKNVYMTKDITEGSSLSHDLMNYISLPSMPVLYLSKFFGFASALEDEHFIAGYIGRDTVDGARTIHLQIIMLDGQRITEYWISESDYLPRKMKEKIIMNASNCHITREQWSNIFINEHFPDSLFSWEPPENWREYKLPSERIIKDILYKKKQCLYDSFTGLTQTGGGTFNLRDYKGKVVLLVFWRLGCPPCRKEMPVLQQLYDKYRDKGLLVTGFNHVDNEKLVKEYLDKHKIYFPNILDPSPAAKKIYDEYRTNIVPLNCLIDREGYLLDVWYGFDPKENKLDKTLETLFNYDQTNQ